MNQCWLIVDHIRTNTLSCNPGPITYDINTNIHKHSWTKTSSNCMSVVGLCKAEYPEINDDVMPLRTLSALLSLCRWPMDFSHKRPVILSDVLLVGCWPGQNGHMFADDIFECLDIAIIWTNNNLAYWRICASLGLDGLIPDAMTLICRYCNHYGDVIKGALASQITSLAVVYSTVYSDADQRRHQSSASLAFVWGIHRGPVNSSHKWPVTRKMFPFDDVIMIENATYVCIKSMSCEMCTGFFLLVWLPYHVSRDPFWPALCAGLLCCNFFDMLTPVPYHHFFSSLILLFIHV